jgi:hypothetical protein
MKSEMVCQFSTEHSDAIFYPILSGFMHKDGRSQSKHF